MTDLNLSKGSLKFCSIESNNPIYRNSVNLKTAYLRNATDKDDKTFVFDKQHWDAQNSVR